MLVKEEDRLSFGVFAGTKLQDRSSFSWASSCILRIFWAVESDLLCISFTEAPTAKYCLEVREGLKEEDRYSRSSEETE